MPKNTAISLTLLLHLAAFILVMSSCKNERRAQQMPESVTAYVYAYTSGTISRDADIKVRFASAAAMEEEIGTEVDKSLIRFSPDIKGTAYWEDEQTLRFEPEGLLTSSQTYVATVKLSEVFDGLPADAKEFEFDFRTRDQYMEVNIDGIYATDVSALEKQVVKGTVYTADVADADKVKEALEASQGRKALPVSWSHTANNREHSFTIEEVERGAKASMVKVSWSGSSLGVKIKDAKEVEVPALSDFKVLDASIVQLNDQYIKLHFSDPLNESQNFAGLVSIVGYGGNMNFLAEGNVLRLYPTSRLSGDHTIEISPGILNAAGKRMANASRWEVHIQDAKPEVRLVGRGVIMPESDGLIFPFDAISLNAVEVEVFKIYHNNILQFLQNNRLDGNYDLRQVGRVILQTKVPLSNLNPGASSSEWTRYALDLSDMIAEDDQAIYQIRIGFRKEYTTYFCSQTGQEQEDALQTTIDHDLSEDGEISSFMNNWYGFDGYYAGYSYRHRRDPCFPAYYNSDRFVYRNVVASNLGLIAKGGNTNNYFVTITDLRTSQPVAGATVEFYDYQQQLLYIGTADDQGMITAELVRKPFVVLAKKDEERGYLRLQEGDALSLSRFDVSGTSVKKGLKGFLYGERGVWRPGDSVFLNFILEDKEAQLPPNYPITFELKDPRGQLHTKRVESSNVNNIYPLHFTTTPDSPTGSWLASVKAGGATFTKSIRVETVKPNRIKINLDFGKESLSVDDEPLQATLEAKWLHGAPASNLKARVEAQLRSVNTSFEGYRNYVFDDPGRRIESEPITVFDGELNGEGKQQISFYLSNKQHMPGRLSAALKTRVFEKGGDFSTDSYSIPYDPYSSYAGVLVPVGKYNQKRISVDEEASMGFVALTNNGKPVANRKLSVGLYRLEWRWWWDRGSDDVTRYNSSNHLNAEKTQEIVTNSKGQAKWDLSVNQWGRYLIRVCDTESGHCSGDYFYAGYPWYGDEDNDAYREGASMLAFSPDKENYNVGETITLRLPEGKSGRALITVENGKKVIESFWAESKEGENTFTFEATPEMAPNIYAHVAVIQPHAQVENDLPIRMYGIASVSVEDPATRLHPVINMPDELKPEKEFTVEVSEQDGQPMAYTVAIVDEGLLGLTRFETPAPWDQFYAKEALGVQTWDVYDQVLGAYGGELERLLSIGGDGAIRRKKQEDKANRFKPVVMHLGPFELGKDKKAKHTIAMPNYVGAVRAMVVAADRGAYGHTDKTVPVRQPLMVLGTLPRVLSPGEELQLPVNVFAMDKKVKQVAVTVEESSGLVKVVNGRRPNISFSKPGDQVVNFPIEVSDRVGVAKFTITATGNGETAKQEIEILVRNPNPYVVDVDAKVLEAGNEHQYEFVPPGMAGTNEAILEVSNIPPINLGERLKYLIRYPYGCIEQTLSGGFPQLYVRQLLELSDEQEQSVPKNIQATIDRLKRFQTSNGGFAYWPGGNTPNHWASSYAGHFLLEAKALGYSVPPSMIEKWTQYQKKVAKMWSGGEEAYGFHYYENHSLMQAYRLFTLALAQEADLSAMNRLREYDDLGKQGRWRLAAAYALIGKAEVATALIQSSDPDVESYRELGYTYGSRLRDRAMFLETLVLMNEKEQAAPLIQYISDEMSSQRWLSTQETAFSLLAIGKYVGEGHDQSKLAFSYQSGSGKIVNAGSDKPSMQVNIPVSAGVQQSVKLTNTSKGVLFTRVIRTGQPLSGEETPASNNLQISIKYTDTEGHSINPSAIPQGTDFIAEVSVTHPGNRPFRYEELALSQVFPSGWEIINTRMDDLSGIAQSSRPEYQDIRDDRVNTFFDLGEKKTEVYRVQLNAAYMGHFYLPAVSCEAMYDNSINAREPGQWVEVIAPRSI
ncbi:MAG: MG2 domain-containing protein [Chitinophagales bacterium]|nr:MG2 domain-containing protein [Chitinophagales bacterium]